MDTQFAAPLPPDPKSSKRWGLIALAAVLLCLCACLVTAGGLAIAGLNRVGPLSMLAPTSTVSIERGRFLVIVRYIDAVDLDQVDLLVERLEDLGYRVERDNYSQDISGWGTKTDAVLYGATTCLEAIDDILVQVSGVADLASFPVIRFGTNDASYEAQNIVLQFVDNNWVP